MSERVGEGFKRPETPEEIFGYLLEKPQGDKPAWHQLNGKKNWSGTMAVFISDFGISLENADVFDCVMFGKAGKKPKTLQEVANTLQEGDDYVTGMIKHLMDGWNMLMFRPEEAIPYKVKFDIGGYPESVQQIDVTRELPKEPQKPSVWKRFAHWITRGSAYNKEFEQYEKDKELYQEELAQYQEADACQAAVTKRIDFLTDRAIAAHAAAEKAEEERADAINRMAVRMEERKKAIQLDDLSNKPKQPVAGSTPTAGKKAPEKSGPESSM